jgi:hypothetical protein
MSYNYYRSSAPSTWGTSNYRFGYPPEPLFRPQPTWGGLDYYQAHALNPDPIMYHRIREGRYDTEGVGLHEARHWHRQAYGGFGDIRSLSPRDIGHAAAYEAYRIWIHNRTISDLRSDGGERREAFIALAVAEVSHIFPTGQVYHERRKFREACETAAATASTIFHTVSPKRHSAVVFPHLICSRCSWMKTNSPAEATFLPAHSVELVLLQVMNFLTISTLSTSAQCHTDRNAIVVVALRFLSILAR